MPAGPPGPAERSPHGNHCARNPGPRGVAPGAGLHGDVGLLRATDDDESTATIHRALELGVTFFDTSDMYGPLHERDARGQGVVGPTRRGRDRDQVRHRARPRRPGQAAASTAGPSTSSRPVTARSPASASITSTSTTNTGSTPTRRSRRRSARWASSWPQGKVRYPRAVRGGAGDHPARPRRAPDLCSADRVLGLVTRPRARDPARPCASSASASSLTARSDAGS